MKQQTKKIIFAIVLALSFLPTVVFGYEIIRGETVVISRQQPVDGNLYVAAQNITIDQNINGDVFCAGQSVTINGNVQGSVFCAGQSIAVNGNVEGSVRVAGNTIMINREVDENVMAFGSAVNLEQDARVGWDLLIGAGSAVIRGDINRSVYGGGGNIFIDGLVGDDVKLGLSEKIENQNRLRIGENARIGGNVEYRSRSQAEVAQGAEISGEVKKNEVKDARENKKNKFLAYIIGIIYSILASLIVAFILIALFGDAIISITNRMRERIGVSIGWGLLLMIITPVLITLLFITLIGIPLALILLALWFIAIYFSEILVGISVGRYILKKDGKINKKSLYLCALVGIFVSWIVFSIPFIGWLLWFVAIWWGLGGVWLTLKKS
ncbi:MAG TPA: hypothetical protein DDY52_05435 [Candidatus Moranbacteria bacterium]|nr:MAG: hypothetical protein UR51_C0002G0089 [Candidatus Moranbacteria bacterium GW2011_GWF1_34_10]HBI17554.1 hypothetical protein [Candidatus Moranbacteria bacterium]